MIQINAIGDACPLPVVKTLRALQELGDRRSQSLAPCRKQGLRHRI